jgi:hypothetical protein
MRRSPPLREKSCHEDVLTGLIRALEAMTQLLVGYLAGIALLTGVVVVCLVGLILGWEAAQEDYGT